MTVHSDLEPGAGQQVVVGRGAGLAAPHLGNSGEVKTIEQSSRQHCSCNVCSVYLGRSRVDGDDPRLCLADDPPQHGSQGGGLPAAHLETVTEYRVTG